jgi:hypothetical protein
MSREANWNLRCAKDNEAMVPEWSEYFILEVTSGTLRETLVVVGVGVEEEGTARVTLP